VRWIIVVSRQSRVIASAHRGLAVHPGVILSRLLDDGDVVGAALDDDAVRAWAAAPEQQEDDAADAAREAARVPPDTPEDVQPTREPRWRTLAVASCAGCGEDARRGGERTGSVLLLLLSLHACAGCGAGARRGGEAFLIQETTSRRVLDSRTVADPRSSWRGMELDFWKEQGVGLLRGGRRSFLEARRRGDKSRVRDDGRGGREKAEEGRAGSCFRWRWRRRGRISRFYMGREGGRELNDVDLLSYSGVAGQSF